MALLSPQQIGITGTAINYTAVTASDTVVPDDRAFLIVKNTTGTVDNAVVIVPGADYGQSRPDVTVTVPITTGERMIGPLVADLADPTTGLVTITHSNVAAGVTSALVRI